MSVSVGNVTKPYVSAVALLDQREIYKGIIDQYNDDEWLDFLTDSGSQKLFTPSREQSPVPIYNSFQNDALYSLLDLASTATVTNGSTATITLTGLTAAMTNTFVNGSLLVSPGGTVWRASNRVAATSATLTSVTGVAPTIAVTNAMKLSVFSNAQAEASSGADAMRWNVSALYNYIQLFSNSITLTDVQLMSGVEVEINGKPYMLPYEMIRGLQRHRGDISLAFWMGQLSATTFSGYTNDTVTAGTAGFQTTRGMDSYITTYGINGNLATSNTVTLSDIRTMNDSLQTNRAPMEYFAMGAQSVISQYSDFLKNLPSSSASQPSGSGINSSRIVVNGREIDLEVETFKYGGRKFMFKALNVLSNSQVINFDDGTGNKLAAATSLYLLPNGMSNVQGQGQVPYFRYRYMKPQQGIATASANRTVSDTTVELLTGGLAPNPTDSTKSLSVEWYSNMGLEVFNPNKFARINSIAS